MANVFPEWQTDEIVEDVPEFLGGKQRELPAGLVRHRGRVPPKKSTKNSVSPKAVVGIHSFECQAIEDDLVTDSLCAPSPLTLEIGAANSLPGLAKAKASPPTRSGMPLRASPDNTQSSSPAPKVATTVAGNKPTVEKNTLTTTTTLAQPRPPATRGPRQLTTNPRQVSAPQTLTTTMATKSINGTPNRLSPTVNELLEWTSTSAQGAPPATVKPSPAPVSLSVKRGGNTKSSPSVGSLDDAGGGGSSCVTPSDTGSRSAAAPFSAPVLQSIPGLRRETSAPTAGPHSGEANLSRTSYSAEVAPALGVKQTVAPPLAAIRKTGAVRTAPTSTAVAEDQKRGRMATNASVPAKPVAAGREGRGGAAATPQPASRSRTAPRASATTTMTSRALPSTSSQPNGGPASSPDVTTSVQRPRAANGVAHPAGPPTLPRVLHADNPSNGAKEDEEYATDELFPLEFSGGHESNVPVSEEEPLRLRQSTRAANLNGSMASSAGYSVLRGAFDSYATMDFGSTLPSLANLNATQGATSNAARVGSARPANMMTVNTATALRAKSSFARTVSSQRKAPANAAAAASSARGRAVQGTPDNAVARQAEATEVVKPALRTAPPAPTAGENAHVGTQEIDEGDDEVHDKHRKRAPQTKRELRRRSTDFEKV